VVDEEQLVVVVAVLEPELAMGVDDARILVGGIVQETVQEELHRVIPAKGRSI
jgi:hypothetical protein